MHRNVRGVSKPDFFHVIDTEEKAYWLGFLYADGCVSKGAIILSLKEDDEEHIRAFRNAVGSEARIGYPTVGSRRYPRLSVGSNKLVQDLAEHGLVPRKARRVAWPVGVPVELEHHFVRGLFDGDGSIVGVTSIGRSGRRTKSIQPEFSIVGYEPFMEEVQRWFVHKLNLPATKIRRRYPDRPIAAIRWSGKNRVEPIYNLLYDGATVWLARKRQRFGAIFDSLEARHCTHPRCKTCHPEQYVEPKPRQASLEAWSRLEKLVAENPNASSRVLAAQIGKSSTFVLEWKNRRPTTQPR